MKKGDKFHNIIDSLIDLNKEHRKEIFDGLQETLSPAHYAAEFCTVTCDAGRRMGKSEYIKRRATPDCLVVAYNKDMAKAIFGKTEYDVLSARQIINGATRGKRAYKVIFVDDAQEVFRAINRQDFYRELAHSNVEQIFVLLGA